MVSLGPIGRLLLASAPALMLSACGGGGGGVNSTPTPPATTPPATTPPATQEQPPVTSTPTTPAPPSPPSTPTDFNTVEYRGSAGLVQANAITAYNRGATGRGVTSAIIDGGIDTSNADFAGRISAASADVGGNRGTIRDEGGHGTAVAAVLGAARNDAGPLGMAFETTLLIARSDTPGSCASSDGCDHRDSAIARGVDLAVRNNARVINMSLGGSPADPVLRDAIGRATAAGIVVVIAGGNDALADPDAFAQIANDAAVSRGLVVIAGATSRAGDIATFSNRAGNGAASYLMALGERVLSYDQNGGQFLYNGTSFSAPLISGAVALLAQAFPNLTGQQIVQLLYSTATDLGATGTDTTYGRGALNLTRAFAPQGQTALAGTAVAVALTGNGTLSAAMGDATAKVGASAVILDGYGRAYDYPIKAGLARSAPALRLTPALASNIRGITAAASGAVISLSIAGPSAGIERLTLAPAEARRARAVAGLAAARLDPHLAIAFGFAQSGKALADTLGGRNGSAFLVAVDPLAVPGFERQAGNAVALRRALGRFGLTLSAERGEALTQRSATPGRGASLRGGYALTGASLDGAAGPLAAALGLSRMREADSVLGARFGPAFGAGGANTDFVDAALRLSGGGWTLSAGLRRGWTHLAAGGIGTGGTLRSGGHALDIAKAGLVVPHDRVALRLSQPLRVSSGGYGLRLPVTWDYTTGTADFALTRLDLAPSGRERDAEASYATPLFGGWISTNLFWRRDPGHVAGAPDDLGGAIRFAQAF